MTQGIFSYTIYSRTTGSYHGGTISNDENARIHYEIKQSVFLDACGPSMAEYQKVGVAKKIILKHN